MKEGTVIIKPFDLLLPEAGIAEGMGGLVGFNIHRSTRKLKLEELCAAKSCQALQAHNSQTAELKWVQCDSSQCKKWYHLQFVGVEIDSNQPRKWFCGCSKFNREAILRYNKYLHLIIIFQVTIDFQSAF